MPVRGRLDLRCSYGAPWRIEQGPGEVGEIPYHAVVAGSAVLELPAVVPRRPLNGDILLLPAIRITCCMTEAARHQFRR